MRHAARASWRLTLSVWETYEQVSATTSYEVLDVGLQQVNEAQDTATVVVFGRYVAKSVTSRPKPSPGGLSSRVNGTAKRPSV